MFPKSATYEVEAEERRRTSEEAKSIRQSRAKFSKVVDLIGLGVMIAVVLPSHLLCLLSFVSELAAILSTMVGVLAILLGVIVFFLILFVEGADVSGRQPVLFDALDLAFCLLDPVHD